MDDIAPTMTASELETAIGKTTAPRVTKEQMQDRIKGQSFHRLTGTLTVCVIELDNGFTVTGESACASPENYRQDIGEKIAYDNAFEKLWALFGFLLKEELYNGLSVIQPRGDQVEHLVNRFLSWRLPEDFSPDNGITFTPVGNKGTPHEYHHQPSGTNLFTSTQAHAMVRYMLEGVPPSEEIF